MCAFIENSIKAYFNPRSLAGATATSENAGLMSAFQSTLPCGSDSNLLAFALRHAISIHAPLRERPVKSTLFTYPLYFNPRSLAGATGFRTVVQKLFDISIHAPLRERQQLPKMLVLCLHFNPRSLAGATLISLPSRSAMRFQSTLPCGSDL